MRKLNEEDFKKLSDVYDTMTEAIGFEAAFKIATIFEGETVFFKKLDGAKRPSRNRQIIDEFNGYNFNALAKKYELTPNMIRLIVKNEVTRKRNAPEEGQISFFNSS